MSTPNELHIWSIGLAEAHHAQEQRMHRHRLGGGHDLDPGDVTGVVGDRWIVGIVLIPQNPDDPDSDTATLVDDDAELALLIEETEEVDELIPCPSTAGRPLPLQESSCRYDGRMCLHHCCGLMDCAKPVVITD